MKMRHSFVLLAATVCMALTFDACKKGGSNDDDNKPTEQPGKIPGMGETAGTPEGEQYVLPAGITLSGTIVGDYCDTTYQVGSGEFAAVCVGLLNSKTKDTTIILPAGLVILSTNAEYQHGVVVQEARILLKAKKITRVGLGAYCINSHKSPSSYSVTYTLGPVSSSPLMKELIGLLRNKKTSKSEFANEDLYQEASSNIQGLVWGITDDMGSADPAVRQIYLDKIPNK
ncbi:hypothetical protein [Chitinophaga barathri]|uniref:Uncharacterized protein n=1 Tax=Chitinophaga barathri TaxID=1647451 RepID=A0A3N4M7A2_9BACT|nr:hypothetical protein [Chitinophaga barathri]RPD39118.1 hypothetical protein EG028_21120 [Chitinophaga barathri]